MNEVRLSVFTFDAKGQRKELYRNVIKCDVSLTLPFDSICRTMSLLYPSAMIEFSMHL